MKFLKSNLKVIIGFIIGVILAGGIVYATVSATEVDYTTEKNTEIKNVSDALNDLYSKLPTKTLLWTNSNPTENFTGQTITLDSSLTNYTYMIIKWKFQKNDTVEYEDMFKIQPYRLDGENNSM